MHEQWIHGSGSTVNKRNLFPKSEEC